MTESKICRPSRLEADQLVGQPGDGVGFAAAGGVLDQVAPAGAVGLHIGQGLPHHAELVVARPDLAALPLAGARVLLLHDLGVVLQDVRQPGGGEHLAPEVVGLEAVGVGRVARAVVVALVEGQEPGAGTGQLGTHAHLAIVHGEVDDAAAELEEPLAGVAVAPVLLHGVIDGLLGEAVLQLEGGDRQAVDEQAEVEGAARLVHAVGELAGDREAVLGVQRLGSGVARRRRAVEQVEVDGPVLHALAQHIDDAAFADLGGEAGEELEAVDAVGVVGRRSPAS